jgi:hypothetical protein
MARHASASARVTILHSVLRGTPAMTVASQRGTSTVAVGTDHADLTRAGLNAFEFPFTEHATDNGRVVFTVPATAFPA